MADQPTVTRGTAVASTITGAGVGLVSSDAMGVLYQRAITGEWPTELSASTLGLLGVVGSFAVAVLASLAYIVVYALAARWKVPLGHIPIFRTRQEEPKE